MMIAEVPFSELLSVVIDNRGKTCPTAETGIPLIATNCIRNELLYPTYDKVRFVSQDTYNNWFRGHPKPGDIIFVNKATPGRVCLVPDPVDFCIAQDMVAVRADPKRVYPNYLFAVLRSPVVQEKIGQMHVGSLIPHFKKGDFDKLLLPILGRKAQEFIGDTYFDLSAKIDANRRMNVTLEALAQTLFKSWFVDTTQSALPKGWSKGRLDEMLVLQRGFDLPSTQRTQGPYPVLCASGPNGTHGEFMVRGPGVTTGRSGSLGQVYFVHEDFWPHNTSLWVKEFKHSTPLFAFHLLRTLDFGTFNSGSAVPTLNRNHVHNLPVNIPPMELIQKFEATVSPMYQRLKSNDVESRTLAALRDALLPKLLSGELRVPAAEKLLEAAT